MDSWNVDAAYLTRPVSIAYLTGFQAEPHERLMALAVRPDSATLIVPALEQQNASAHAAHADVVAWRDGEDPYELVKRAVGTSVEIAVEKDHLSLLAAELITSRTGASELVDIGPEIRRQRLIKHEDEIEKLVRAAAITDAAGEEVISCLHAGMTEVDVALMIASAIGEGGGTLSFTTLAQSGPNSALPHLEPSGRKLAPGDFVLLDFGGAYGGYKADTTRMVVVGEPSARHSEIHGLVLEAHDAAIDAVRPGITTGDVDAAARSSKRRDTASASFTASVTASGWRLTKTRASILARRPCSRQEWCSPSSRASTFPVGAEYGSKTTSSSKKADVAS